MALLDFLKKKEDAVKSKKKTQPKAAEVSDASDAKEVVVSKEASQSQPASGKFSSDAVKEPHISEKSTNLGNSNKYIFKVGTSANKPEVKKSVEGMYGVSVVSVHMINIPKKKRRLGRTEGFKKAYRKAIVTIREGQKIELF